jgi:hypothetical protein
MLSPNTIKQSATLIFHANFPKVGLDIAATRFYVHYLVFGVSVAVHDYDDMRTTTMIMEE